MNIIVNTIFDRYGNPVGLNESEQERYQEIYEMILDLETELGFKHDTEISLFSV